MADFRQTNPSFQAEDSFWTPVRDRDLGSYGANEMITASATFSNVGDVGNSDWMDARELVFRDQELETTLFGGRVMMQAAYEDHPNFPTHRQYETRSDPAKFASTEFWKGDPTSVWLIEEVNKLLDIPEDDLTAPQRERKLLLENTLTEVRGYHLQQTENMLEAVPAWALDAIHAAHVNGMSYDPRITEGGGGPSALKSEPVGYSVLPSYDEWMRFHNQEYPTTISAGDTVEYCTRLKHGKKDFGPFGPRFADIELGRPANGLSLRECSQAREDDGAGYMRSLGFSVKRDEDGKVLSYDWNHDVTSDNLEEMSALYGRLAANISSASSVNHIILDHRDALKKEILRDTFLKVARRMKIENLIPNVNAKKITVKRYLEWHYKKDLFFITGQEAKELLTEKQFGKLSDRVYSATKRSYLLQVRGPRGYETMKVTKDAELAAEWRACKYAEDIPYFFGNTEQRRSNPRPGSVIPEGYDELPDKDKREVMKYFIELRDHWSDLSDIRGLNDNMLQVHVEGFNAGHKTKTIQSSEERQTNWLINCLPATQGQLSAQRGGLKKLGASIIQCRIGLNRTDDTRSLAFRKIAGAMRHGIYQKQFPRETLVALSASDKLAISFDYTMEDVPQDKSSTYLVKSGQLHSSEVGNSKYCKVSVTLDEVFTDQSKIFTIVGSWRVPNETKKLAQTALQRGHF